MTQFLNKSFILVIEDNKEISEILAQAIVDAGYTVAQAREGGEAIALIKELGVPQLVITDIFMPGMEGLETIIRLREQHEELKIIAISGGGQYGRKDILQYAKNLGADYTLEKPINFDELFATLYELLGHDVFKQEVG